MNDLKLIYVHYVGLTAEEKKQYILYFMPNNLEMYNENWKECMAGLFNDKFVPDKQTVSYTLITNIPLDIITKNLCLGMRHAIDNVVALAWEDISDYEEYPEEGRLILNYGISLEEVKELLNIKGEKLIE